VVPNNTLQCYLCIHNCFNSIIVGESRPDLIDAIIDLKRHWLTRVEALTIIYEEEDETRRSARSIDLGNSDMCIFSDAVWCYKHLQSCGVFETWFQARQGIETYTDLEVEVSMHAGTIKFRHCNFTDVRHVCWCYIIELKIYGACLLCRFLTSNNSRSSHNLVRLTEPRC
jgi:hypothetical protein